MRTVVSQTSPNQPGLEPFWVGFLLEQKLRLWTLYRNKMVTRVKENCDEKSLGTQGLAGACWGDGSQLLSTIWRHLSLVFMMILLHKKYGVRRCVLESKLEREMPLQVASEAVFWQQDFQELFFSFSEMLGLDVACLLSQRGTWTSCLRDGGCRTWCTQWIW